MDMLLEMLVAHARAEGAAPEQIALIECEDIEFEQAEQIWLGIKGKLPLEKLARYARLRFSAGQMELIRRGFMQGWNTEDVLIFGRPEFSMEQMRQIYRGLEAGMPPDLVVQYADPALPPRKMARIRLEILAQAQKPVLAFVKPEADKPETEDAFRLDRFTPSQIVELRLARKDGLTDAQMEVLANHALEPKQMAQVRWGFSENHLKPEQVRLYARPEFDEQQMLEIRRGLDKGLTATQIYLYADPRYNNRQMCQIRLALIQGLDEPQLSYLLDNTVTAHNMQTIRTGFARGQTAEDLELAEGEDVI